MKFSTAIYCNLKININKERKYKHSCYSSSTQNVVANIRNHTFLHFMYSLNYKI